jgi:hypothetical protein
MQFFARMLVIDDWVALVCAAQREILSKPIQQ